MSAHDLVNHRGIFGVERQPSGDQQIQKHAGGENSDRLSMPLPQTVPEPLGWRTHQRSRTGDAGVDTGFIAGDAEVKQLDGSIRAHNDVRRLDIPMDDAVAMCVSQGQANLLDHTQRMLQLQAFRLMALSRGSPSTYSMTMYGSPS